MKEIRLQLKSCCLYLLVLPLPFALYSCAAIGIVFNRNTHQTKCYGHCCCCCGCCLLRLMLPHIATFPSLSIVIWTELKTKFKRTKSNKCPNRTYICYKLFRILSDLQNALIRSLFIRIYPNESHQMMWCCNSILTSSHSKVDHNFIDAGLIQRSADLLSIH